MKLQRLNVTNIDEIEDFLNSFNIELNSEVISYLRSPYAYVIVDEAFECMTMYTPINRCVYNAHVYKKPNIGGSRIKKFICITAHLVMTETECNTIFNFVDMEHKHLMMLMGSIGSQNLGTIKSSLDGNDAILYCSSKQELYDKVGKQYNEVITWV